MEKQNVKVYEDLQKEGKYPRQAFCIREGMSELGKLVRSVYVC